MDFSKLREYLFVCFQWKTWDMNITYNIFPMIEFQIEADIGYYMGVCIMQAND